jgi:hypothetical protein
VGSTCFPKNCDPNILQDRENMNTPGAGTSGEYMLVVFAIRGACRATSSPTGIEFDL